MLRTDNLYSKQDATMTKGMAILCMVVLHLFCRTGKDVFGTHVIWINATTPLDFYSGFSQKYVCLYIRYVQDMHNNL